jgi:enoyl-CoA hydratase/carnithine racemase
MVDPKIFYEKENGIGLITLNRPERMNAVNNEMQMLLGEIIADTILNDEVRVVIITGTGRAFCGGTDVSDEASGQGDSAGGANQTPPTPRDWSLLQGSPLPNWRFTRIPKPTIAAVNGAAVGVGAEWTIQCDIRIASENARFGWVFSQRGLVPDTGAGYYLLPSIVGMSKALELMYSGEIIDAQEALRIGLVSMIVPPDDLIPSAKRMAQKLLRGAPLSLKGVKELTYGTLQWTPNVHRAENVARFTAASLSEDCKEGIKAFLEKRPPVWKGK